MIWGYPLFLGVSPIFGNTHIAYLHLSFVLKGSFPEMYLHFKRKGMTRCNFSGAPKKNIRWDKGNVWNSGAPCSWSRRIYRDFKWPSKKLYRTCVGTRFFKSWLTSSKDPFLWPFQGWKRDLHLGNQKVTLKKLVGNCFFKFPIVSENLAPMEFPMVSCIIDQIEYENSLR